MIANAGIAEERPVTLAESVYLPELYEFSTP